MDYGNVSGRWFGVAIASSAPIFWWAIRHLLQRQLAEVKGDLQAELRQQLADLQAELPQQLASLQQQLASLQQQLANLQQQQADVRADVRQQQADLRADLRQLADRLVKTEQQPRSVPVTGPARPTGTSAVEGADMRGAVWGSGADSDSARGSGDGSGAGPSGGHEAKV